MLLAAASCTDEGGADSASPDATGGTTAGMTEATSPMSASDTQPGVPTSTDGEPTSAPGDEGGPTTPVDETGPDDTTTTGTDTDDTTTTGTDTTGTTTTGTDAGSESETGETDAGGSGESVWCGNVGTGALVLDSVKEAVRFAASNGGPGMFAGWVNADHELRMAIYDVGSAVWGEPATLAAGYDSVDGDFPPLAAVDGEGNAILAYLVAEPAWHLVAAHYDAGAQQWKTMPLPGDLVQPRMGAMTMTADGHAVVSIYDRVGPGLTARPLVRFYDPLTGAWSEPVVFDLDSDFSRDSVRWAQDPVTGDVALVQRGDKLVLRHHDAATDELAVTEVELKAMADHMAAIGDGEFVLVSDGSEFGDDGDIYAQRFDGVAWQPPEVIGSGYSVDTVRIVGAGGRAVASWNDGKWGTHARAFDPEDGWTKPLTVQETEPDAPNSWADHRLVLADDGFFVVWSSLGAGPGLHTLAPRHAGGAWSAAVDLDLEMPTGATRVEQLVSLGDERALAVWVRDDEGQPGVYACHAPKTGWSPATLLPVHPLRVDVRPGGGVLVMTPTEVEFFAPG